MTSPNDKAMFVPWRDTQDAADGIITVAQDLGKAVRKGACYLYRRNPDALVPNPIEGVIRGMWNRLCEDNSDDPTQDLPTSSPPFEGGQCVGANYRVFYSFDRWQHGIYQFVAMGESVLSGKIGGVKLGSQNDVNGSPGPSDSGIYILYAVGSQATPDGIWGRAQSTATASAGVEFKNGRITGIQREDGGLLDSCGNLPDKWDKPKFDPNNPPSLPPYSRPPDGNPPGGGNDFSFSVPLFFVTPVLNAPVTFNLGGLTANIDLGGVTFNLPDGVTPRSPEFDGLRDYLPPALPPSPDIDFPPFPDIPDYGDSFDGLNDRFDDLGERFDDLENPPPPDPDEILEEEEEEPTKTPLPTDIKIFWKEGVCTEGEFEEEQLWAWMQPSAATLFVRHKQVLFEIAKKACAIEKSILDNPGIAAVPDYWTVRLGADRPIMLITFRRNDSRTYYSMSIPYPGITEFGDSCPVGNFRGGDFMVREILQDNSKVWVNAVSQSEADRVHGEMIALVESSRRHSPPQIFRGQRAGQNLRTEIRKAVSWEYLPDGHKKLLPGKAGRFKVN